MTVVKVTELVGISNESWEDAAKNALKDASKTIDNITGIEVLSNTARVKDGELTEYRSTIKIAFGLTDR
ncbi:MAG: dodecin family protein [Bacillota bacterium]